MRNFPRRNVRGSLRPRPGTGSHEIIAMNRPFAACGKLRLTIAETNRIARSAKECHQINLSRQNDVFVTHPIVRSSVVSTRSASIQVWFAVAVLGANGAYLLFVNWGAHFIFAVAFGVPWIIAAVAVALRKSWARPLVFSLTGLFVVAWFYYFVLNINHGAFVGWSRAQFIISTVVATIPFVALGLCCYVVAKHLREPTART
jgi:hypothetical protein